MAAIAFIGLGQMGSPMASNLLQQVWGSDQFWAEFVQPGRTCKPCVARGVVI